MRVASFFRNRRPSFDLEPKEKKKSARSHSSHLTTRPNLGARPNSNSSSDLSISSNDSNATNANAHSTTTTAASMADDHKRNSFSLIHPARGSSRSLDRHHERHAPAPAPTALAVQIESPPLVFYGQPSTSTGALLSGQLKLSVADEDFDVESFKMRLVVDVKMKKPFHAHCADCANQSSELTTWRFLQGPTSFKKGEHDFPFSFLLPGHLPASMHGSLSSIAYILKATITPKTGEPLSLSHPLSVRRAIQPSDLPRQSIRIFPPTNLTAHVSLPSVIHPIGEFTTTLRLDGIVRRNADTGIQTHWKLKRLTWRLDETQRVISPACAKHALKSGALPDDKKGAAHQEVRTLNSEELKTGWKADYSSPDGSIELEFPFSMRADAHPVCDVKAGDGTEVSHMLVVEMIVAEEQAPTKRPSQATPTGAARVLRMHFNAVVTERGGLGISWDEEQPPLYENVPASPPGYGHSESLDGAAIPDYEELERLPGPRVGVAGPSGAGEA